MGTAAEWDESRLHTDTAASWGDDWGRHMDIAARRENEREPEASAVWEDDCCWRELCRESRKSMYCCCSSWNCILVSRTRASDGGRGVVLAGGNEAG